MSCADFLGEQFRREESTTRDETYSDKAAVSKRRLSQVIESESTATGDDRHGVVGHCVRYCSCRRANWRGVILWTIFLDSRSPAAMSLGATLLLFGFATAIACLGGWLATGRDSRRRRES